MKIILLFVMLVLCGCGYNDFSGLETPDYEVVMPNTTIGFIASRYRGEALNITDDIIVSGVVTANDQSNNFYRTFVIQDETGALEVKAGMFDLHNIFPRGRRVAIMARGLVLDSYNGVPQLAAAPDPGSSLPGYIANRYYPGSYFAPQTGYEEVVPARLTIGELTDRMCGMLVRIDGLTFLAGEQAGEYITWADAGATGFRTFGDGAGGEITVGTSDFADFADREVPRTRTTLTGILMKGNTDRERGVWILKLRSLDDVAW